MPAIATRDSTASVLAVLRIGAVTERGGHARGFKKFAMRGNVVDLAMA